MSNEYGLGGATPGAQGMMDAQDRIKRELETPIICLDCGSTWFTEMKFNQYSDIAYGSGPGGDIRQISNVTQELRVCICGKPHPPNLGGMRGRTANVDAATFATSMTAANRLLVSIVTIAKHKPVVMNDLVKVFASLAEHAALSERVDELEIQTAPLLGDLDSLPAHDLLAKVSGIRRELPVVELKSGIAAAAYSLHPDALPAEAFGTDSPSAEPHPNSREGKMIKAQRLAAQRAIDAAQDVQ